MIINLNRKKMKKISILLILAMLTLKSVNLFSQNRVNKPTPIIGTKVKGQLTKSTGWILNPEGQWVSRSNKIPSYLENQYKILMDHGSEGLGIDNFISYQIREIKIQDSTYSILIKKYKDGYYKYSSLNEGWTNYNSVMFYVFNKNELRKLDDVVNDSINLIKIKVLYSNSITWINNETYISDIQKEIAKEIYEKEGDKEAEEYLVFQIAPYKPKNIVQFQIYSSYSKYNIIGGIIKEYIVKDEKSSYSSEDKNIYLSKDLFKYCYYEVDYLTFNNFMKITK
jgi:hypothetical protein